MLKKVKIGASIFAMLLQSSYLFAQSDNKPSIGTVSAFMKLDNAPMSSTSYVKLGEYQKSVMRSAKVALKSGMPALAQSIVEEYIAGNGASDSLVEQLREIYIDSLIMQGNFEQAIKQLTLLKANADSIENRVRAFLAYVGQNNLKEADKILASIDESKISSQDMPWFLLAKGYAALEKNRQQEALDFFEKAKGTSQSDFVAAYADIALNLCRLSDDFKGANLVDMEKDLSPKVSFYMGTPIGFQFAKQYAAVLYKLGKIDEALEVIDQQLDIQLAQEIDKDELRIFSALMIKNPEKQTKMLHDIIRTSSSVGVVEYALALLAKNPDLKLDEFDKFLVGVAKEGSPKIADRILLELSKLSIRRGDKGRAAKIANQILADYPASRYRADALKILAWTAFAADAKKSPEYRLAATYLMSLADLDENSSRANSVKLLAADCYYLNKDYSTAAKIYQSLYHDMPEESGALLNRAVEAYLQQGDYKSAEDMLDTSYGSKSITANDIWNGEWKLISYYRKEGEQSKALVRIEHSLKNSTEDSDTLRLRMIWLKARLMEEDSQWQKTVELCDTIIKDIAKSKSEDKSLLENIAANTMLMKARCYEMLNKTDIASEIYKSLRGDYPKSQAAELSYLYNARAEASKMHYLQARQICQTLIEKYPDSKYRYAAMQDSAQYARLIGTEANYKIALALLDTLCTNYPDDPRNFYTRLSQAEILRLLNLFADARSLYNEIINKYSSHPELYLASLGLGDSMLAQPNRALDAAALFERIYYLPDVPAAVRAESAFKWSYALERADRMRESNEVRWLTSSQILESKNGIAEGSAYWVARSLFALAKSLESQSQMRDARAAYELIVKYKLPSYSAAERKLKNKLQ